MILVNVAKDFTPFPAGRYKRNGDTSGEAFRERFLEGPLSRGEEVTVEFDGAVGYGSSFLEEAFGGVVRQLRKPADELLRRLTLRASDPSIAAEIEEYMRDADRALKHQ